MVDSCFTSSYNCFCFPLCHSELTHPHSLSCPASVPSQDITLLSLRVCKFWFKAKHLYLVGKVLYFAMPKKEVQSMFFTHTIISSIQNPLHKTLAQLSFGSRKCVNLRSAIWCSQEPTSIRIHNGALLYVYLLCLHFWSSERLNIHLRNTHKLTLHQLTYVRNYHYLY